MGLTVIIMQVINDRTELDWTGTELGPAQPQLVFNFLSPPIQNSRFPVRTQYSLVNIVRMSNLRGRARMYLSEQIQFDKQILLFGLKQSFRINFLQEETKYFTIAHLTRDKIIHVDIN